MCVLAQTGHNKSISLLKERTLKYKYRIYTYQKILNTFCIQIAMMKIK